MESKATVRWLTRAPFSTTREFYRRVRPSAALRKPIARLAPEVPPARDLGRNALDWIAGCALIYGTLFGAGKVIFKDYPTGAVFLAVALAAGLYIYRDLSRRHSASPRTDSHTARNLEPVSCEITCFSAEA